MDPLRSTEVYSELCFKSLHEQGEAVPLRTATKGRVKLWAAPRRKSGGLAAHGLRIQRVPLML